MGQVPPASAASSPDEDTTVAQARAAYAHARRDLQAAEVAYAHAARALQAAQAPTGAAAPVAPPEWHYACGHAGMVTTESDATHCLSLCPVCAAQVARESFLFAPRRTLLLPGAPSPERRHGAPPR